MSAEYSLAGMFPPNEKEIWNEALLWQAIPVHTVPEQIDHVLAMKRSCHLYMDEYKKYLNSSEVQSIFKDNHELIEYLKLHTGQDFTTVFALKEFHEILSIENAKNFTYVRVTFSSCFFFTNSKSAQMISDCQNGPKKSFPVGNYMNGHDLAI